MGHLSKPKEFSDCSVSGSNENASDSERGDNKEELQT